VTTVSESQITIDAALDDLQYRLLVQRLMTASPGRVRLTAGPVSLEKVTLARDRLADALVRETGAETVAVFDQLGGEPRVVLLGGSTWALELHLGIFDDTSYGQAVNEYGAGEADDAVTAPVGYLSLACVGDPGTILAALAVHGIHPSLQRKDDSTVSVTFAFQGARGPNYREGVFDTLSLGGVRDNYSPVVVSQVERLLDTLREKTHGLVFLGGPTGTGKSYLVRCLLSELRHSRKGLVCSPALDFLRNPGLLLDVASRYRRALVILEDVGEVLEQAAQGTGRLEEVSGLLNLSEGLLSILSDTVLVLSSNVPPDKLNPALLRPGRCLGRLEVGRLEHDHAERWLQRQLPKRSYALAELYALKEGVTFSDPSPERTGFLHG
jgi:hypothetical protein